MTQNIEDSSQLEIALLAQFLDALGPLIPVFEQIWTLEGAAINRKSVTILLLFLVTEF